MASPIRPGGVNRFVTATVIIYFQRYPGTASASGIANVPYTLRVDGRVVQNGVTAADGRITLNFAPTKTGMLEILGSTYEIHLRNTIEALNTVRGVQRRLNALGYELGGVDGTVGQGTDRAALNFQADNALDTDGVIGSNTRNRLRARFGE